MLLAPTTAAWGDPVRLREDTPGANDTIGRAVAISGDFVAFKIAGEVFSETGRGALYVYRRSEGQWVRDARIESTDQISGSVVSGHSVDLDGEVLVTSNSWELLPAGGTLQRGGAVYVYRRSEDGWGLEQRLTPQETPSRFGQSIALDGRLLAVGERRWAEEAQDIGTIGSGVAYVYEESGGVWQHRATLSPSPPDPIDHFGEAIAISDGTVAVGASPLRWAGWDLEGQQAPGSVHMFERTTDGAWVHDQKLRPSDSESLDLFGRRLALNSDFLVASGNLEIYIFQRIRDTWIEIQRIGDLPGHASGLSIRKDNSIAAGFWSAPGSDPEGPSGTVLIFEQDPAGTAQWAHVRTLGAAQRPLEELFGMSVDLGERFAAVGSPPPNTENEDAGAVYIFDVGEPCCVASPSDELTVRVELLQHTTQDGEWFSEEWTFQVQASTNGFVSPVVTTTHEGDSDSDDAGERDITDALIMSETFFGNSLSDELVITQRAFENDRAPRTTYECCSWWEDNDDEWGTSTTSFDLAQFEYGVPTLIRGDTLEAFGHDYELRVTVTRDVASACTCSG